MPDAAAKLPPAPRSLGVRLRPEALIGVHTEKELAKLLADFTAAARNVTGDPDLVVRGALNIPYRDLEKLHNARVQAAPATDLRALVRATPPRGGGWRRFEELAAAVRRLPSVERAWVESPPAPPPSLPHCALEQAYRAPAPLGLGVHGLTGWRTFGASVGFADIEKGWWTLSTEGAQHLAHEDLPQGEVTVIAPSPAEIDHGTQVLGVVLALSSTESPSEDPGCVGIAPGTTLKGLFGTLDADGHLDLASAIARATLMLAPGDVLLVEAQVYGSDFTLLPVHADPHARELLQLAVDRQLVVVLAAGNGGTDLDRHFGLDGEPLHSETSPGDLILVAAGERADGEWKRLRLAGLNLAATNHGSRIDCFGPGRGVVTLGQREDGAGWTSDVVADFSGTSAASAVIAGAALVVQGAAKATGRTLTPRAVRDLLRSVGTSSVEAGMGTYPDLASLLALLSVDPDVYIRRSLGDTGVFPRGDLPFDCPDLREEVPEARGDGEAASPVDPALVLTVHRRTPGPVSNLRAELWAFEPATLVMQRHLTRVAQSDPLLVPLGSPEPTLLRIPCPGLPVDRGLLAVVGSDEDPAPRVSAMDTFTGLAALLRTANNLAWRTDLPARGQTDRGEAGLGIRHVVSCRVRGPTDIDADLEVIVRFALSAGAWVEAHLTPSLAAALGVPQTGEGDVVVRFDSIPFAGARLRLGGGWVTAGFDEPLRLEIWQPPLPQDGPRLAQVIGRIGDLDVGRAAWNLLPPAIAPPE